MERLGASSDLANIEEDLGGELCLLFRFVIQGGKIPHIEPRRLKPSRENLQCLLTSVLSEPL